MHPRSASVPITSSPESLASLERSSTTTKSNAKPHTQKHTCTRSKRPLRRLQRDLLYTPSDLLFRRLRRRSILALLCSLYALGLSLLRLLTLLLCLLGSCFTCLLFLGFARLFTAELLAPLLLLLGLDLREEVAGCSDLVADGQ